MKEKDLKIKEKQRNIQTNIQTREFKKDIQIKNRSGSYSPIKEKMKAEYIREKNRKPSEKGTSEASVHAEEDMEDMILDAGTYAAGKVIAYKQKAKEVKQKKKNESSIIENYNASETISTKNVMKTENQKLLKQKQQGMLKKKLVSSKAKERKERQKVEQEAKQWQERKLTDRASIAESQFIIREGNETPNSYKAEYYGDFQKKSKKNRTEKQYQKEGKRKSIKDYRIKIFSEKSQNPKQTISKMEQGGRLAIAIKNTTVAFVKGILAAVGGLSGIIVVFVIIGAVLALVSTAFGVFFSSFDDTEGTRRIAEIVAETNNDFYDRVDEIEADIEHDKVVYHLEPDGGSQLFITNWHQVVAVFAAKTSGEDSGSLDVVTMDDVRAELLQEVFWDMNELTYKTKKEGSGEDKKTVLHITLKSRSYEEMIDFYDFTKYQEQALRELMQPEYAQMLSELVSTLGITGGAIELTDEQIQQMMKNLPEDLSPKRKAVVEKAYSLVGKVNYFWGGKSEVIGWDSRWGTPKKVTAAGSGTTGMILPFGLDCSGFVTWTFINATGDPSYANVIGHGARNQYGKCKKISWSEAMPGDLVFYPDLGHVGIVVGKDGEGDLLIAHCTSSQNNVVVTGLQGFTKIGRPVMYL